MERVKWKWISGDSYSGFVIEGDPRNSFVVVAGEGMLKLKNGGVYFIGNERALPQPGSIKI